MSPLVFRFSPCSSFFMHDVYSLLLTHSPWQDCSHWGRVAVQLGAVRGLWNPLLRLCSFLSHSYSPPLCRPLPDNAVTTCSIKQPQPGWRDVWMCGSMTVVKDLVDVWQRRCNPSGNILYVEGAVALRYHSLLTVRQIWLWFFVFWHASCLHLGFCPLSKEKLGGLKTLDCSEELS